MPEYRTTTSNDTHPPDIDLAAGGLLATQSNVLDGLREPIIYRGERVLTTERAAEAFGVDAGRLSNNFERNRKRFEEGKHFFMLTGSALREMKDQPSIRGLVAPQAAHLLLWTERGIARHAKMLESDTAWEIYEELEDTYFRVRDAFTTQAPAIPTTFSAALLLASQQAAALEKQAEELESERIARIEAQRTKAQIGDRRQATAMKTASDAMRKARKLEAELDRSRQFATVKRMELLYHGLRFEWRKLKTISAALGVDPIDVFDANYGKVKAYHYSAWLEAYALEIPGRDDETEENE